MPLDLTEDVFAPQELPSTVPKALSKNTNSISEAAVNESESTLQRGKIATATLHFLYCN